MNTRLTTPAQLVRPCPSCGEHGAIESRHADPEAARYGLAQEPVTLRKCPSCRMRFFDLLEGVNTAGEIYARMPLQASAPRPRHRLFAAMIARRWPHSVGMELGAGACHVGRLMGPAHEIVAIDRHPPEAPPHIEYVNADLTDLHPSRFDARAFNWILADNILEHLPAYSSLLACVRTWLEPGGWFIVSVPNGRTLKRLISRRAAREIYRPVEHVNVFDGATLDGTMKRHGFRRLRPLRLPGNAFEAAASASLAGPAPFGLYRLYTPH